MTDQELRIRVLTDQLAEARRIADLLGFSINNDEADYKGDADHGIDAALEAWYARTWKDAS